MNLEIDAARTQIVKSIGGGGVPATRVTWEPGWEALLPLQAQGVGSAVGSGSRGSLIAGQLLSADSLLPRPSRDIFNPEFISAPFVAATSMGESPLLCPLTIFCEMSWRKQLKRMSHLQFLCLERTPGDISGRG